MQADTDPTFPCPHCRQPIHLTQTLAAPLIQAERARLSQEIAAQTRADFGVELKTLQDQVRAQSTKLQEAQKRELGLLEKERELAARGEAIELELAKRVKSERESAAKAARESTQAEMLARVAELQADADEKSRKLAAAQAAELELRKAKGRLEEEQREWELEKQRQIDAEKSKVREQALRDFTEGQRLKDAEKEKIVGDLRSQIADLQRKVEQGSQQLQGEVQELDLEATLKLTYPLDEMLPVAKGIRGADCLQRVAGPNGLPVGTILWESKRTRAWSDGWLPKLRTDQRESRADFAILVTAAMPPGVERFASVDGVWVTDVLCAMPLAQALRHALTQTAAARAASTGRETKTELLYEYLCGPQFRARVEGIVEAFTTMRAELDAEKRATEKQWAKREKQLERVLRSTSGMYGDLQGIAGSAIAELPSLAGPDATPALPDPSDG